MMAQLRTQPPRPQEHSFAPVHRPLLQRKCACGGAPGPTGECEACRKKKLQRKLTIGASNDPLEQEANRIADEVLAAPAHSAVSGAPPRIQRFAGHTGATTTTAPASVDRVLSSPGKPLEPTLRQDMEQRFGHDFSQVRVHSNEAAEQSAREVDAQAYTVGPNIVFGAGRLASGTNEVHRLIAHELTHVVQQSGLAAGETIWRQPARTTARTVTDSDRREFVRDATSHFAQAAQYYATHAVDSVTFDRVINAWYALLANQEELIRELGGGVSLMRPLQTAYTDAVRALLKQASLLFNRSEADLYRENSGRIAIWAWLQPHAMQPFISTPIPQDLGPDQFTGEVNFAVNGWAVTIKQDGRDPSISRAETRLHFEPGSISRNRDGTFVVPTPAVTIQTFFSPGSNARSRSAYGRGTTKEDIAGGKVTPHSTSLGFHEGHHGLDYVEFLKSNRPPAFTGTATQTNRALNAAIRRWKAAWTALNAAANRSSTRRTDCVGNTKDQFEQTQDGGTRVPLVCVP